MKILKNKTAAVTGVTSGLGRMLAVRLAGTGATKGAFWWEWMQRHWICSPDFSR